MKLNIVARRKRFCINVSYTAKILEVKHLISDILKLSTTRIKDETDGNKELFCLIHNGIYLNNNCTVSEVGLTSGSTLRYKTNKRVPSTLRILVKCLSTYVEFRDEVCIQNTTILYVRRLLQNCLGIPVSVFTLHRKDNQQVLFDSHLLSYYDIVIGDTLVLEVWKGTKNLILAAMDGDISRTMSAIPSYQEQPYLNRYLLKVVLFIAAHKDIVNLAAQIVQRGVRCDEAVGEHPSREWCIQQSHPDIHKAPIHQAAMNGSFRTLSVFIRHRPACIVAKDGNGQLPSTHAWKNNHAQCWKLIMAMQEEVQVVCSFTNLTLTMYSRIMRWCHRAKDRVLYFKAENKKQVLVQAKLYHTAGSCLGEPIVVSGLGERESQNEENKNKFHRFSAWSYNMQNEKRIVGEEKRLPPILLKDNKANMRSTRTFPITNTSIPSTASHRRGVLEAKKIIYDKTGKTAFQIARSCFEMGQAFENMKWRSQMNVAMKRSVRCIDLNRNSNTL